MPGIRVLSFLAVAMVAMARADYSGFAEDDEEEPIQVIVQRAGPSQTFEWLGNGHDEDIHPRRPPVRPTYLFMGRPDFVVSYIANSQHGGQGHAGHAAAGPVHHQQQLPSYAAPPLPDPAHGHQQHHGAHGRTQHGHATNAGHSTQATAGQHHHQQSPAPGTQPQPGKVFDPVTPLYKLPAGSGAPVGDHPLPPPPPPLVDGVRQEEHQYPPFGHAESTPNQAHENSYAGHKGQVDVQIDDPNSIPTETFDESEDPEDHGGSEVTEVPLDIVTAAVAEDDFEDSHSGAASTAREIVLKPNRRPPPFQRDQSRQNLFIISYDDENRSPAWQ